MEARQMGVSLTPQERFEIFGPDADKHFGGEYAQEADQRWGQTEPSKQSQRRTSTYTKQDWVQIKADADANQTALAAALRAGLAADSAEAMDLAENHRQHITRWCYECGYDIHRGLAQMYVADHRFTQHYEDVSPGLAQYVHDAIIANAERATTG
jgi:MerR family transcriptional regulator, thiopeptide resistance regulator